MKSHQEIIGLFGSENPFEIFESWFQKAKSTPGIKEPSAMTLSTCSKEQPASRVVLLKEINSDGFIFYTNYKSQKSKHLDQNPQASLLFYWDPLGLQVRVSGLAHKVKREISEEYWGTRPRGSQLSQWISHQSEIAESREQLEGLVEQAEREFEGKPIPCPKDWGGFVLIPKVFEFWIGRENRLHDRFKFTRQDGDWAVVRLFP